MSRRAAGLERLDDDHATTATWAGMEMLVCRLGAERCLLRLRRLRFLRLRRGDQLACPLTIVSALPPLLAKSP